MATVRSRSERQFTNTEGMYSPTLPRVHPLPIAGGTTFHFRDGAIEDVLREASNAAADLDVRVGCGYRTARSFLRAA